MDFRREFELLEKAISTEAARTDALAAAVAGLLQASRENPELAKLVSERLDQEYTLQAGKPESEHYLRSFEVMREYLRKLAS
jgi:hypothetical protein